MNNTVLLFFLLSVVAIFALMAASKLYDWWRSDDHEHAIRRHFERATDRGLSASEALTEFAMRESYVRIRRIVSDAVLAGVSYHEALALATKAEASLIASTRGLATSGTFRKWMNSLTIADVLYQDAYDLIKSQQRASLGRFTDDQIAALQIAPRSK